LARNSEWVTTPQEFDVPEIILDAQHPSSVCDEEYPRHDAGGGGDADAAEALLEHEGADGRADQTATTTEVMDASSSNRHVIRSATCMYKLRIG
jgi:hypothetical protein